MTCIVGVSDESGAWVGGDSLSGNSARYTLSAQPKVFRKEDMVIGITGSWRFGQLLHYTLTIPTHPDTMLDDEYMAVRFSDAVRRCLKDRDWLKKSNERVEGGNALVGYHGKIYEIQRGFDVMRSMHGYSAVGSGEDHAVGALAALDAFRVSGEARVKQALMAAEKHNPFVRPPFTVLEVP